MQQTLRGDRLAPPIPLVPFTAPLHPSPAPSMSFLLCQMSLTPAVFSVTITKIPTPLWKNP